MASLISTLSAPTRILARTPPSITVSSSSSAVYPTPSFSATTLTQLKPLATPDNKEPPPRQDAHRHHHKSSNDDRDDFYLNLGTAVRTLRDDLPALFSRDLNYDIYREDVTFADPLNSVQGIDNYRLIFWALRFHGRMLFKEIGLDVLRIWQLSDDVILVRWNLKGVPRVPWEARGEFQGTSRYKLDRRGKIYEHRVDNLAFNFPKLAPANSSAVMDLVVASAWPPAIMASPSLRFLSRWNLAQNTATYECSWVEFYRAVLDTIDPSGHIVTMAPDGLITCS